MIHKMLSQIIVFSALAVSVGIYLLTLLTSVSDLVLGLAYLLPPVLAAIKGAFVVKTFGLKSSRGRNFLLIASGLGAWAVGEMLWVYFDVRELDPFPSIADVLYILGYPLMIAGLLGEINVEAITWTRKRFILTHLFVFACALITLYWGVFLAYDPEASALANAIVISYGIGDLFLLRILAQIINLTIEFKGGLMQRIWLKFAIGIIFTWIAYILFAIYTDEYESWEGYYYMIDLIWFAGYTFFALSFIDMASYPQKFIKQVKEKIQ